MEHGMHHNRLPIRHDLLTILVIVVLIFAAMAALVVADARAGLVSTWAHQFYALVLQK